MIRSRTIGAVVGFGLVVAACSSGADTSTGQPEPDTPDDTSVDASPQATPSPETTADRTATGGPDPSIETTPEASTATTGPELDDQQQAIVDAMTDELLYGYSVPYQLFIDADTFDCFLSTYVAGAPLGEFNAFGLPESGADGAEQWLFAVDYDQHISYWNAAVDCIGTDEIVAHDIAAIEDLLTTPEPGATRADYEISDTETACLLTAADSDNYRDFQWYAGFAAAPTTIGPGTQLDILAPWTDCLGISTFILAAYAPDLLGDEAIRDCIDTTAPQLTAEIAQRGELMDLFFRFLRTPPTPDTTTAANAAIAACT